MFVEDLKLKALTKVEFEVSIHEKKVALDQIEAQIQKAEELLREVHKREISGRERLHYY